jgi:hypothetical protein
MAESNISRDHIAMEAMKVIMEKTVSNSLTLKNKIRKFFGLNYHRTVESLDLKMIARISYDMADAMISQREKKQEVQK